jgi:protein-S-isoprenylcysteine O-methyltransferase Ste14
MRTRLWDPHALVGLLWAAWVVLWVVLAQFNKKTSQGESVRSARWVRLAILIGLLIVISLRGHGVAAVLIAVSRSFPIHPGILGQWVGVGLCVSGFAFAIWARGYLGSNWGMPMSLRLGHELVTSGPYAYVRHPIYAGIMLAMVGAAVVEGLVWLALFALYFAYFLYSARTEEKMMAAQFPEAYPAYRRRTKMLIPFVL